MHKTCPCLALIAAYWIVPAVQAKDNPVDAPGCTDKTPKQCVDLALEAMGGRERLQQLKSVRLHFIGSTLLTEQSYRQAPFITSYARGVTTFDLVNQRVRTEASITWPEADVNQSDIQSTSIVGPDGGVTRGKDSVDSPCSLAIIDSAREMLALGPARLLITASDASDLHFESPEILRSTAHTLVAFKWRNIPVRVLLNRFNHLPDAVETTREFQDFWYFWGDVDQRIYFDNWKLVQGIAFPTNLVEERNNVIWSSTQALNVEFNVPIVSKSFSMDDTVAKRSAASHGWGREFQAAKETSLAPGITLFPGPWNSTIVKQSDGVVILEAPISGLYTQGVIAEAKKRYPGERIKAVLSTSDSWPHVGGVRYAVSQDLPVYILDLNKPLLDRLVNAPHKLDPDSLQKARKDPHWISIAGKELVGAGANTIELYPIHGPSTERQYMAYFPQSRLLYASDTLALNADNSLYDPELMREVVEAVKQANLKVDTVFAMHEGPMPWSQVTTLLEKADLQKPSRP